ncbi:hypothetical protein ACVWZA_001299 [Sphingomonas sp. UYAg733]
MYRSTSSNSGTVAATLLAGPIFVAGILVGTWSNDMDKAIELPDIRFVITGVPAIIIGLALIMLAGVLISGIPNFLGTWLMRRLGRYNPAMRLPAAWALAGGLATGMPLVLSGNGDTQSSIACFGFSFAGAVCALICRWHVTWEDDSAQPLSGATRTAIATQ